MIQTKNTIFNCIIKLIIQSIHKVPMLPIKTTAYFLIGLVFIKLDAYKTKQLNPFS